MTVKVDRSSRLFDWWRERGIADFVLLHLLEKKIPTGAFFVFAALRRTLLLAQARVLIHLSAI